MLRFQGFTLVELLIAATLGALVISYATSNVAMLHHAFLQMQLELALKDEIRTLHHYLKRNLRQADFNMPPALSPINLNPTAGSSISISNFPKEKKHSCVTFSFDKNHNGKVTQAEGELMGFRLRDYAIEQRVSGASCKAKGWHDITDSQSLRITHFSIAPIQHNALGGVYEVEIDAKSTKNFAIVSALKFTIHIPNAR